MREHRENLARAPVALRALRRGLREMRRAWLVARHGSGGLELAKDVVIFGWPRIEIVSGGVIRVGARVTLNSEQANYHASLHSPVRLVVSRPGASIEIGADSRIHGSCLHARQRIVLGERCLIAANCQILDSSGHDPSFPNVEERVRTTDEPKAITIGSDVWLGLACIVLPGVSIGRGTIVAAGSVVSRDLPEFCVCGGVPAKVLKRFDMSGGDDR